MTAQLALKLGSLCSGIGGLELGLERALNCETVWQVELEPPCRAVLATHWPNAERFDDVFKVGSHNLSLVDIICFGSPCQDLSSAGKRAGLHGPKSRLFFECARVVGELQPEWVVFENVASGASRWVDPVRCELEKLGYASLPVPIAASDCGAPHRRARVLLVAHADGAKLRQQSGGAAGRSGKVRLSLQQLARLTPHAHTDGQPDGAEHAEVERQPAAHGHAVGESPRGVEDTEGALAEAHAARNAARPPGELRQTRSEPWSQPEPHMVRMVSRLSARLDRASDRIAALGNSCVPSQAEVAGHVIRVLIEAERRRVA